MVMNLWSETGFVFIIIRRWGSCCLEFRVLFMVSVAFQFIHPLYIYYIHIYIYTHIYIYVYSSYGLRFKNSVPGPRCSLPDDDDDGKRREMSCLVSFFLFFPTFC